MTQKDLERDFSRKTINTLKKLDITIIGKTWLPGPGGDYTIGETGYKIDDKGTSKIKTHTEILDIANITIKLKFKFHNDPGHGWLAVKISLLQELGITNVISQYSHMRGQTAYLEQDRDAGIFINAFRERFGIEPTISELMPTNSDSPIRSYKSFKMPSCL